MEREPASDIITGAGSRRPRIDATGFHIQRKRLQNKRLAVLGGRASANKNKESKNNEYSTAVNAPNEMVKADDDTDSKEKTETDDAIRRVEAENHAEASSSSSHPLSS